MSNGSHSDVTNPEGDLTVSGCQGDRVSNEVLGPVKVDCGGWTITCC